MDWKKKLTSRKFWMAIAALVVGVLTLFKVDANTTTQISGVVLSLGAVIAYIVGEGLVDAASAGATVNITGNPTITGIGDENPVAKAAGDIATAAQAIKAVAEDVAPSDSKAVEATGGADVKVTADAAKASEAAPETSESTSKTVIG